MTFPHAIVERCGVPIVRKDAAQRMVFGEIMRPAPRMADGEKVKESELSGIIHYDGGYMVAEEIRKLVSRYAIRRPIIDVEHDGEPRGATLVQSFLSGEGWDDWQEGAWVGGVQVHEDDVWDDVDADVLRAFSVAFMVKVRSHYVVVEMDVSGGDDRKVQLHEFIDPQPHALSLVKNPATGAMWKMKVRSMPNHPVVDREWDADAACERVCSWAGDDLDRLSQAFAGTQVADVEGGRLVVVRSRVGDAMTWLASAGELVSKEDRATALSELGQIAARRSADDGAQSNGTETGAAPDGGGPENNEDRDMGAFADHLDEGAATLVDGTKALFNAVAAAMQGTDEDGDPADAVKGILSDFTQWGHAQVDELGAEGFYADAQAADDADGEAADDEEGSTDTPEEDRAEEDEDDGAAADEDEDEELAADEEEDEELAADEEEDEEGSTKAKRAASTFTGKMKLGKFNDHVWQASYALMETMREIIEDEDVTEKTEAMRDVLGQFSEWMDGLIGELDIDAMTRALEAQPDDIAQVFRAGRKIATKNLKKLEDLAGKLLELIQDLSPKAEEESEDTELSADPAAPAEGAAPAEDTTPAPPEGTNVDRSAGGEQDGTQQALLDLLKSVQENQGKLVERMADMESGRPAPGAAGGLPVGTTDKDPRAKVRDFFFPKDSAQ